MREARPSEDTLLLAATAAALAKRGWPAAKTAALLAEALPHGPVRAELSTAAEVLARGERLGSATQAGALSTTALLARGEEGGAESLAELAKSHALELRARRLAAAGVAYPATGLAFGVVLIALGGYVADVALSLYGDLGVPMSGAATVAHGLLSIAGVVGWILAVVSLIGVIAALVGRGFLPGVTSMRAAASLRRVAAALGSGIAEGEAFALAHPGASGFDSLPVLRARERALAKRLAAIHGVERAARSLAEELERDAREASRLWRLLLPYLGLAALVATLATMALSILSPILSIGGIL